MVITRKENRLIKKIIDAFKIMPSKLRLGYILLSCFGVMLVAIDSFVLIQLPRLIEQISEREHDQTMMISLIMVATIIVAKNILIILYQFLRHNLMAKVQTHLSLKALKDILSTGVGERKKNTSHAIVEPLQLVLNVYAPVMNVIVEGGVAIILFGTLIWIAPTESLIFGCVVGSIVFIYQNLSKHLLNFTGKERRVADAKRQKLAQSYIAGKDELTVYKSFGYALDAFSTPTIVSSKAVAVKAAMTDSAKNVIELSVILAAGLVVAFNIFTGEDGASLIAIMISFGFAAYRLMPSLNRILVSLQSIRYGIGAINDFIDVHGEEKVINDDNSLKISGCVIKLKNYPLSNGVLFSKTVELRSGQLLLIKGPSGIGKSTLLKRIIYGKYDSTFNITFCNKEEQVASKNIQMSLVSQTPIIFPGSIRENVTLNRFEDAMIDSLDLKNDLGLNLSAVEIDDEILSGGEKAKLSVLRAVSTPACLRLLDEPTSSLDEQSKRQILHLMQRDINAITIIVTHDTFFDEYADCIVEVK